MSMTIKKYYLFYSILFTVQVLVGNRMETILVKRSLYFSVFQAPRPPTQPRGLRKDEDFPTLGPAQAKDATTTGIRYMKPKYKGLKVNDANFFIKFVGTCMKQYGF